MLIASRLLGALAQAGTLIVLARVAGPSQFGAFGATLAIGAVLLGIGSLGMPTRALLVSEGEKGTRVVLARAATVVALLVGTITYLASNAVFPTQFSAAIAAAAAFSGAETVVSIHQNLLFGAQQLRRAEILMIVRRALPLIAVVAFVPLGAQASLFALLGGCVLSVVASILLVFSPQGAKERGAFRSFAAVVRESRPYWLTNIGSMAQQLDVTIVALVMGPNSAAGFAAGFRFASPVHIVTGLLVARMMPTVQAASAVAGRITKDKYFRLGLVYAAVVLAASPAVAVLVILLLGTEYGRYQTVIAIFFVNSGLSVINQLTAGWLFAKGWGHMAVPVITGASTVIGLLLVLLGALAGNVDLAALGTLSIQALLLLGLICAYLGVRNRRKGASDD